MNVKKLTHSQQQQQAPNAQKKKSTVRLTTRITMLWALQQSLLYRFLVSVEIKCKTHIQQQRTQLKTCLGLVNLTEKDAQHTYKAPCCCFDLLFFELY